MWDKNLELSGVGCCIVFKELWHYLNHNKYSKIKDICVSLKHFHSMHFAVIKDAKICTARYKSERNFTGKENWFTFLRLQIIHFKMLMNCQNQKGNLLSRPYQGCNSYFWYSLLQIWFWFATFSEDTSEIFRKKCTFWMLSSRLFTTTNGPE